MPAHPACLVTPKPQKETSPMNHLVYIVSLTIPAFLASFVFFFSVL